MSTVKILRKAAGQIQANAAYEDNAMQSLPLTGGIVMQEFDMIEDESISGEGFRDIPQQGGRHVTAGGIPFQFDKTASQVILEAAFGNVTSKVFTLGDNAKKMSICALDSVNANMYANMYLNRLAFASRANEKLMLTADFIGKTAQDRQVVGNFPSVTAFGLPFVHQEFGGASGFIRIGDAANALASGDNQVIEELTWEVSNAFGEDFANQNDVADARGILTPLFGQGGWPEVSGSFVVARHDSDQWFSWAEDHTPLQMSAYCYKAAAATVLIEIPRFVIKAEPTDDDTTKINVTMLIGRNGTGTDYTNTNMSFTSPIRVTIVDA